MPALTLSMTAACGGAALVGGFIDAIAGGGGLLTMPALLLTGVPPHLALGTNKISSSLGTAVALGTFARSHLVLWRLALAGLAFSLLGSWVGSLLALHISAAVLGKILVGLLPVGMLLTLAPKRERQAGACSAPLHGPRFWLLVPLVCLLIGVYDGFFGPGTGSFLILALHWVLRAGLIEASATSKVLNLGSNVGAAAAFIWHGTVFWPLAAIMTACSMLGNWFGSRTAIRIGPAAVRRFLMVSLGLLLLTLIWRYFLDPA
ncbi:TSUP family transporter [uncultured Desulfovibrio sp.]|uniref:sulfite exporter TauE/SafE family protein n=1 Tax=uncultured Desulfovibrio sp. TaxID=167968 RepID=UPI0025CCB491|nr:TSUP family transporter [uncultured Desulfovibrio sp.]